MADDQNAPVRIIGPGDNNPPLPALISRQENFAAAVTAYLNEEYAETFREVDSIAVEIDGIVLPIRDDAGKAVVMTMIKRGRDMKARLEAFHTKEKEQYLRGGQATDQSFFGRIDRLMRRSKTGNLGKLDVLGQELTDYDTRVLREKQLAARREADRLAAIERQRLADLAEKERVEREAREAAERARKPEHIETKTAIAEQAGAAADAANVEAAVASAKAEEAYIETLRKPADLMRTRGADGTLGTMGEVKFSEITDRDLLPKDLIWAHIDFDALDKAVRRYAVATNYAQQIPGASIGKRARSQVR